MKLSIALHLLVTVLLTLAGAAWLYPLNTGAIAVVFVLANSITVVLIWLLRRLFGGKDVVNEVPKP